MLFCSTHPTEKVWCQIYIEEKLLFQVRYNVVPKCGTTNQMGRGGGGGFLKHENEALSVFALEL